VEEESREGMLEYQEDQKRAPQGKPMKRKIGAQVPVKRPKEPVQQH